MRVFEWRPLQNLSGNLASAMSRIAVTSANIACVQNWHDPVEALPAEKGLKARTTSDPVPKGPLSAALPAPRLAR